MQCIFHVLYYVRVRHISAQHNPVPRKKRDHNSVADYGQELIGSGKYFKGKRREQLSFFGICRQEKISILLRSVPLKCSSSGGKSNKKAPPKERKQRNILLRGKRREANIFPLFPPAHHTLAVFRKDKKGNFQWRAPLIKYLPKNLPSPRPAYFCLTIAALTKKKDFFPCIHASNFPDTSSTCFWFSLSWFSFPPWKGLLGHSQRLQQGFVPLRVWGPFPILGTLQPFSQSGMTPPGSSHLLSRKKRKKRKICILTYA